MKIECNLWLGEDGSKGVMVNYNDSTTELTIEQKGSLTADEHAASHFIVELVRCLTTGRSIEHSFNPLLTPEKIKEQEQLVKCRWSKSGKLLMLGEASKHWKHATSPDEAILKQRVFTCTRSTFNLTPKRRVKS